MITISRSNIIVIRELKFLEKVKVGPRTHMQKIWTGERRICLIWNPTDLHHALNKIMPICKTENKDI